MEQYILLASQGDVCHDDHTARHGDRHDADDDGERLNGITSKNNVHYDLKKMMMGIIEPEQYLSSASNISLGKMMEMKIYFNIQWKIHSSSRICTSSSISARITLSINCFSTRLNKFVQN